MRRADETVILAPTPRILALLLAAPEALSAKEQSVQRIPY